MQCRGIGKAISFMRRWRRTGWLGREDSNLQDLISKLTFEMSREIPSIPMNSGHQRLFTGAPRRLALPQDDMRPELSRMADVRFPPPPKTLLLSGH